MAVSRVGDAMTTNGGCGGGDRQCPSEVRLARATAEGDVGFGGPRRAGKPSGCSSMASLPFEHCRCSCRLRAPLVVERHGASPT
jgi:hypothetical protein